MPKPATYPRLETNRLILRGFTPDDAAGVERLAGERDVAATTGYIPHPYPAGMAEEWIGSHAEDFNRGIAVTFAVTLRATAELLGACGLTIRDAHKRGELGFWIGKPYWGRGFATEAARAVIAYGFSRGLRRIFAEHFHTNPASGRVLQKCGMTHEGTLRRHMLKWGEAMDCEVYGILAEEFTRREKLSD
jgi:ribosomal-protein-alanine N-acetyltransferase